MAGSGSFRFGSLKKDESLKSTSALEELGSLSRFNQIASSIVSSARVSCMNEN